MNAEIATFGELSTDRSSVAVVDMWTGFSLDLLGDFAHPNDEGDEELAVRWVDALVRAGVVAD